MKFESFYIVKSLANPQIQFADEIMKFEQSTGLMERDNDVKICG